MPKAKMPKAKMLKDSPLILIAEDEAALSELLAYTLERDGFKTKRASDGRQALTACAKAPIPDLILLDWMLPGPSGIDVCKRIRRDSKYRAMPIIMLTARNSESDRVEGLNAGADDYLAKPFSMKELVARIQALLRRTQSELEAEILTFGDLEINRSQFHITFQGKIIPMSPTGFKLLSHLAERPAHVFSRESLLDAVWGKACAIEPRTVDANIKRVRHLLKHVAGFDPIRTVRGLGYVFDKPRI